MRRHLARRTDERGAVLVMTAVGMVVFVIAAALAIDLGFIANETRVDQKVADLSALDAVRVLPADPTDAANLSAARNGFPFGSPGYSLTVEWASDRTGPWTSSAATLATATAVRVTAYSQHRNAFPFVADGQRASREAVAVRAGPIATVRVGSSLATLDTTQSLLLNEAVSALVGGDVSLDAVGWEGLASGHVTFAALVAEFANVTGDSTFNAGSVDEVLAAEFTAEELFTATANVLRNDGNAAHVAVANSVQTLGVAADETYLSLPLSLYDLFDFGSVVIGDRRDVAHASLNVLQLIQGGAIIANDAHFASFDLEAADIVGIVLPGGFSGVTVSMGLIEAPQQSFPGKPGVDGGGNYYTQAHTSQIRIRLDVRLRIPLTSAINIPLVGSINVIDVTVPYYMDIGQGHAYLQSIQCAGNPSPTQIEILGATDAGTANVGFVTNANLSNQAVNPTPTTGVLGTALGGLVRVSLTGTVSSTIGGNPGVSLDFSPPYADSSPSQPVPGTAPSLPNLAATKVTATVSGILDAGLLSDVLTGINASGITFSNTLPGVNATIVQPLLDALGLSFAGADVWAPSVATCAALSANAGGPGSPPVLAS